MSVAVSNPVYLVASHKVLDPATIKSEYVPQAMDLLRKFDVEILCANENTEVLEGQTGHDRLMILRFANRDEAIASDLMAPRDEGHIVPDPAAVERFRSGDLTTDPRAGRENASPSPRPHLFLDSDHIWSLSAAHP